MTLTISPIRDAAIEAIRAGFGVGAKDLMQPTRGVLHVARARQALYALLKREAGMSLPKVGRLIGRDHTTVIYGVQKIAAEIAADPELLTRWNRAVAVFAKNFPQVAPYTNGGGGDGASA